MEISPEPSGAEVPHWHREILDRRDLALREGREQVLDWDEAREQIRRAAQRPRD